MERSKRRNSIIIIVAISAAALIILITAGFVALTNKRDEKGYVLRIKDNTVVLYIGDKIDEAFPEIVVDNLPLEDIRQLENGIIFSTKQEAMRAVEDYDG